MSRRTLIQLGILIIVVTLTTPTLAEELVPVEQPVVVTAAATPTSHLEEWVAQSDIIVHGAIESAASEWVTDEWGTHIWTTYLIRVVDKVKGAENGDTITLRVIGGAVGDMQERIYDVPRPPAAGEAILFLSTEGAIAAPRFVGGFSVTSRGVKAAGRLIHVTQMLDLLRDAVLNPALPLDKIVQGIGSTAARGAGERLEMTPVAPCTGKQKLQTEVNDGSLGLGGSAASVMYSTARVWDAWTAQELDLDGDGYYSSLKICWDPDVRESPLDLLFVHEEIWVSYASQQNWTKVVTTQSHIIVGWVEWDSVCYSLAWPYSNRGSFDFAIDIFRDGISSPDDGREGSNDSDLAQVPLEPWSQESVVRPVISSISPTKASAGTGTRVTIQGSGFGASPGLVAFTYNEKEDDWYLTAPIVSWMDTQIVAEVPRCQVGQCGNYPGSASSGPVYVRAASGALSTPLRFDVSFGVDGSIWPTKSIPYRISTSMPSSFASAVRNAFGTWSSAAGITSTDAGTTTGTTTSHNGLTELTYGPLPPGVPPSVIAYADCFIASGQPISECDIHFNSQMPWSATGTPPNGCMDVQSVAVHEIGHWLVLLDLYGDTDMQKVMYGHSSGGASSVRRSLQADDIAGARYLYGAAGSTCTYSISPTSQSFSASGGTGSVAVTASAGGCTWTATTGISWVTVTGGASGTGNGTVSYSVAANSSTSSRSGTLTIAGQTFTVSQAAGGATCTAPTIATHPASTTISSGGTATLTVTATGTAPLSYQWYRGLAGDTANLISGATASSFTTPVLTSTTSYWVRVTNTCGSTNSNTATVTVSGGGAGTYTYVVASVAHTAGSNNTQWRTDISVVNRNASSASMTLQYIGATVMSATHTLGPWSTVGWRDILVTLFGSSAAARGAVKVTSNVPLAVVSRTYDAFGGSTRGQSYPALQTTQGITQGQVAVLPHLTASTEYRSNVGFLNLGSEACTVTVKLFGTTGTQLGSSYQHNVPGGGYEQADRINEKVGTGSVDLAYATVEVNTPGCRIWTCAAVVDQVSGDPTTIEMIVP